MCVVIISSGRQNATHICWNEKEEKNLKHWFLTMFSSKNNFCPIEKLSINDFQSNILYRDVTFKKNYPFPHVTIFHWFLVLFGCLIHCLFNKSLMENIVLFKISYPILELMVWNPNLTKLDIVPSWSSNMTSPVLLINEHL